MISTEKIADSLTCYILKNKIIKEEDSEIYKYGFLIGMEMFMCIAICYCIAIRMKMVPECTVFFSVFLSLRSFVGGIHMNSYKKCFVCSCIVLFLTLIAVNSIHLSNYCALGITCFEILIVFFSNPVENLNRPVNENEKKIFAHRIKQILLLLLGAAVTLFLIGSNSFLVTITYTLGIIIISMLLGKTKKHVKE